MTRMNKDPRCFDPGSLARLPRPENRIQFHPAALY
jgi:hypothetical protein